MECFLCKKLKVGPLGIEPRTSDYESPALPLSYRPIYKISKIKIGTAGRTRTGTPVIGNRF